MQGDDEITHKKAPVPIPRPRRVFLKKAQYENVSISDEKVKVKLSEETDAVIDKNIEKLNEIQKKEFNKFEHDVVSKKLSGSSTKSLDNSNSNVEKSEGNYVNVSKDIGLKIDKEFGKNNLITGNPPELKSCNKTDYLSRKSDKIYERIFIGSNKDVSDAILPSSNVSSAHSRASTPEPFYVNEQAQFYENQNFFKQNESAPIQRELLYEFDPLMKHRNSTKFEVDNQLFLLENLLQDDIYSNVFGGLQFNVSPTDLSDEDNAENEHFLPPIPTRIDSLDVTYATPVTKADRLIKNNEPIRDEMEKGRTKLQKSVSETTISVSADTDDKTRKAQTSWYIENSKISNVSENINDFDESPPPPYSENSNKSPFHKYLASVNDNFNLHINGKTEINKFLSNFRNKIGALKRKPSLKNQRVNAEDPNNDLPKVLEMIPRPKLSEKYVTHEGFLIRFPSGGIEDIFKELQNRKVIIKNAKFLAYQESEMKNIKESIPLNEISTIQCVSNSKITENSTHYYCFEITSVVSKLSQQRFLNSTNASTSSKSGSVKVNRVTHLYGISKESERDLWMQKILQSLTDVFPPNYACQVYRAGWCYLKKSITSEWSGAWILLQKRRRRLLIFTEKELVMDKLDLRKARCIVMKETDSSVENLYVEHGPILMIDCPPFSLYMIMVCPRETKTWKHIIREVACNNGPGLEEQQLTKHNVPVIVDKCINFVYIHGSMSEGIYRKSGQENSVQKLLYQFRLNAYSVEVTKSAYNEHDVANVLKRFMRNLPQKLLGKYSQSFIGVSKLNSIDDKITSYNELLQRLSTIEFMTMKKIINHLSFIESQSMHNKMTLENLSVLWGPTLLQSKSGNDDMEYNQQEADVIKDLISNFKVLFPLTKDEIAKEKSMLHYLKKYYAASESLNELSTKQSGDLKVWVVIRLNSSKNLRENRKDEDQNTICVILNPSKTAKHVCKEIADKINKSVNEVCLFENIFNDYLERPVHATEKLFHTVLKWSYWPEEERKNNCLILKSSKYIDKMRRTLEIMKNFSLKKTLQYADNKSKNFKVYEIELVDTKLIINKITKNGTSPHKFLDLNDFSVYLGSERKLSFTWAITFIENSQVLSLKNPGTSFAGHVIGGIQKDDQIVIFSNIWNNVYGGVK